MENGDNNHDSWFKSLATKDIVLGNGEVNVINESVEEKNKHKLRNRISVGVFMLLLMMPLVWFVLAIFLSKVQVGGSYVSARTSDAALQALVEQQAKSYKLKVRYPDNTEKEFSLEDIGLSLDSSATVQEARKNQSTFSSRLQWWQPTTTYLKLTSDPAKRDAFIARHATIIIQPPKDSKLSLENGEVKIEEGAPGKNYGLYEPAETISRTVSSLQTDPLQLQMLSKQAAITTRLLQPHQAKLKQMLKQSVAFELEDKTFKAKTSEIADWLEIMLNENGKRVDVNVNSGKVLAYINKITAPYTQPPKAQVTVTRDDGSIAIISRGVEGTDVVNKSEIATQVAEDLLANKPINQSLAVKHATFKTVKASAYDKWIEVDLTNKKMYTYEKSKLIRTFLVSAGAPATPTVTGQFAIRAKVALQDMRGLNVDGSSYFQANVAWVNYFYGAYAIHGNYWRPLSWFGNVNSSHGCVGLPNNEAQWVYSWAPVGTPVIIHY